MVSKTIYIRGMTCAACVSHVTDAISSVPGVESAEVSLATNSANVNFSDQGDVVLGDGGEILDAIASAVGDAGYGIGVPSMGVDTEDDALDRTEESRFEAQRSELSAIRNSAIVSIAAMALIMVVTMARSAYAPDVPAYALNLLFLVIATPIQFRIAAPFLQVSMGGGKAKNVEYEHTGGCGDIGCIRLQRFGDYLTVGAWRFGRCGRTRLVSWCLNITPGTYFEVPAAIIGLVSLGRWLEGRDEVASIRSGSDADRVAAAGCSCGTCGWSGRGCDRRYRDWRDGCDPSRRACAYRREIG